MDEKFNRVDDGVTLTYENVIFPYIIIVVGILLSVCQSACEYIWVRVRGIFSKREAPPRVAFAGSDTRPAWRDQIISSE